MKWPNIDVNILQETYKVHFNTSNLIEIRVLQVKEKIIIKKKMRLLQAWTLDFYLEYDKSFTYQ